MKIASWNVNSVNARLQHLLDFIETNNPDIILLQELKCETHKFPAEELSHLPYNLYIHGQKSYNGVAILSKFSADEILTDFPNNPCPDQARFIETTMKTSSGFCRIVSLYAPNGGEVGSDKFELKLKFYDALIDYLQSDKFNDEKFIIGGDFNIAPYDIDVYSPQEMENITCFTNIEKQKFRSILNCGFNDLHRMLNPIKQEFSWWDYRAGSFERNKGLRIDMILTSHNAADDFKHSHIDYDMRSKAKSSDHAPIIIF